MSGKPMTGAQALAKAERVIMYLMPANWPMGISFAVPKRSVREAVGNLRQLNDDRLCTWSLGSDGTFHLHWST